MNIPATHIRCPQCGRSALLEAREDAFNDNEDVRTLAAPEGFRKLVLGWRSNRAYLYCTNCAVPAEFA